LVPVLVSTSLTINQNLETGTKIDIRLKEGNTQIEKIYLTSKKQDDSEKLFTIIEKDSNYYLQTKEICKNKKYNLVLHIETALGVWEYPIKVTTKQSFPKITVKQVKKPNIQLLYEDAVFVITGKEDILGVDYTTSSVDFIKGDVSGNNKEYQLTLKQKEHGKKIDKKGSVFILFEGYRIPLEKKITITTTNKKIKADTLVASGNKVVLNGTSSTELSAGVYVKLENSVKAGNYSFTYTGMVLKEELEAERELQYI